MELLDSQHSFACIIMFKARFCLVVVVTDCKSCVLKRLMGIVHSPQKIASGDVTFVLIIKELGHLTQKCVYLVIWANCTARASYGTPCRSGAQVEALLQPNRLVRPWDGTCLRGFDARATCADMLEPLQWSKFSTRWSWRMNEESTERVSGSTDCMMTLCIVLWYNIQQHTAHLWIFFLFAFFFVLNPKLGTRLAGLG